MTTRTREYVLSNHARERCRAMGITEGRVALALSSPDLLYPAPGEGYMIAASGAIAVVHHVANRVVSTVLWNVADLGGIAVTRDDAPPDRPDTTPQAPPPVAAAPAPTTNGRRSWDGVSFQKPSALDRLAAERDEAERRAAAERAEAERAEAERVAAAERAAARERRLAELAEAIPRERDPLARLDLIQERLDLEADR